MSNGSEHGWDKLALFLLAALVVLVLGGIVWGVFATKVVPDKGDVLLGGIGTGLILFLQRLVDAVRSSWQAVTQEKTMEQLGKSAPTDGTTKDAAQGARKAADAADDKASDIEAAATEATP